MSSVPVASSFTPLLTEGARWVGYGFSKATLGRQINVQTSGLPMPKEVELMLQEGQL
jgi:hypothetical protein